MRVILVVLAAAAIASAGTVGDYLGFRVNKQSTDSLIGRDSIHYLLPSPSDTVIPSIGTDTTTVIAETSRLGDTAWVVRHVSVGAGTTVAVDTSIESGDTFLCRRTQFGDSVRWLNSYRIPFALGSTWLLGLAGTYIYDFNGDTVLDTLSVWADTCRVLDTEDVSVPYGAVPHCYRLSRTMYQRLATQQQGIPVIESSYIRTTEWYKDSLWAVKESVMASGPIYTWILVWLHAADFVSVYVTELDALGTVGLAARPEPPSPGAIAAWPTLFRDRVALTLPTRRNAGLVRVFDPTGRLVRSVSVPPFSRRLSLDLRSLAPGTYLIRVGESVCPVTKVE
jgi:hypothetical protein